MIEVPCRNHPTDVPRGVHRRTSSNGPSANGGGGQAAGEGGRPKPSPHPSGLPPEINPAVRRSEMFLSAPVTNTLCVASSSLAFPSHYEITAIFSQIVLAEVVS